jgi:B-cell receptor-associated protein 31
MVSVFCDSIIHLMSKLNHDIIFYILSGYALFLALVIDRLHNYIREIRVLKKNLEAVSKENKMILEENKHLHDQQRTQSPSDAKKDS